MRFGRAPTVRGARGQGLPLGRIPNRKGREHKLAASLFPYSLEDGRLSLPESVRRQLGLEPSTLVQVTVTVPDADREDVQEAWARFRQMGRNAVSGRLSDVSTNHDRYLYGRKSS